MEEITQHIDDHDVKEMRDMIGILYHHLDCTSGAIGGRTVKPCTIKHRTMEHFHRYTNNSYKERYEELKEWVDAILPECDCNWCTKREEFYFQRADGLWEQKC